MEGGDLGIQWRREQTLAGGEAEVEAASCGIAYDAYMMHMMHVMA